MRDLTAEFVRVFNELNERKREAFFRNWQAKIDLYVCGEAIKTYEEIEEWFNAADEEEREGYETFSEYMDDEDMYLVSFDDEGYEEALALV